MTRAQAKPGLQPEFVKIPARFRMPHLPGLINISAIFLLLLSTLAGRAESAMYSCMAPVPESIGITLAGTLKDGQGAPITNGWVFVDAARPRVGPGFL